MRMPDFLRSPASRTNLRICPPLGRVKAVRQFTGSSVRSLLPLYGLKIRRRETIIICWLRMHHSKFIRFVGPRRTCSADANIGAGSGLFIWTRMVGFVGLPVFRTINLLELLRTLTSIAAQLADDVSRYMTPRMHMECRRIAGDASPMSQKSHNTAYSGPEVLTSYRTGVS